MVARVSKKSLPTIEPEAEGLGHPTIMDPALAMQHGVDYVRVAVFAIDVDRVREHVEDDVDGVWPFGWEVFLTEVHLLGSVDIEDEAQRAMIEDACAAILEQSGSELVFGAQLLFAVYDAIARGQWPAEMKAIFESWRGEPTELVEELAPLWSDPETEASDLAEACLEVALPIPLAPPARTALEAMVEVL